MIEGQGDCGALKQVPEAPAPSTAKAVFLVCKPKCLVAACRKKPYPSHHV